MAGVRNPSARFNSNATVPALVTAVPSTSFLPLLLPRFARNVTFQRALPLYAVTSLSSSFLPPNFEQDMPIATQLVLPLRSIEPFCLPVTAVLEDSIIWKKYKLVHQTIPIITPSFRS